MNKFKVFLVISLGFTIFSEAAVNCRQIFDGDLILHSKETVVWSTLGGRILRSVRFEELMRPYELAPVRSSDVYDFRYAVLGGGLVEGADTFIFTGDLKNPNQSLVIKLGPTKNFSSRWPQFLLAEKGVLVLIHNGVLKTINEAGQSQVLHILSPQQMASGKLIRLGRDHFALVIENEITHFRISTH